MLLSSKSIIKHPMIILMRCEDEGLWPCPDDASSCCNAAMVIIVLSQTHFIKPLSLRAAAVDCVGTFHPIGYLHHQVCSNILSFCRQYLLGNHRCFLLRWIVCVNLETFRPRVVRSSLTPSHCSSALGFIASP
jgi:hypothetical protein